jgi:hypothetical protein
MRHQGRKPSKDQANHAKQNRRRQLQISRQWLAQTDHNQQDGNDDQYKSGVGHRRRELLNPEKQGRSDTLLRRDFSVGRAAGTPKPRDFAGFAFL